ncbi:DODA-type extradiol aromatic ring-opening family dioxygenase [Aurantimonas endophytica]|uniref:4,5-DOPA dioxygenase extradiol n=1 Tax=Aurantimonas endophytica TaxID=1522175 RepID=A0A7W6HBF7_9HYPH|nr:class III extradiol ring-cleavage dioxygenase [Aurantimonas endophytica]MBB4001843.1 4,5-DOPA dioxygenase extradiol [Aurantimonas endophytica]MCO6402520.1 dioxygenase [Aurantimonas endophytica]
MPLMPSLFISHGSPDVAIAETEATRFLRGLGAALPRPRAIVVASAHFEAEGRVLVSGDAAPETIHDFGGFDRSLYEIRYTAPGDPELAATVAAALGDGGFAAEVVTGRGFDHGTWVPLSLAYPDADIPVIQVSIDPGEGPAYHLRLGEALGFLRAEEVLVIGSGSFTHNLREAFARIRQNDRQAATPEWVSGFADWMTDRLVAGDRSALQTYRTSAPFARENHPTDEHLMPLYVALGAAGAAAKATKLHASQDFGVLAMEAFAFV